MGALLEPTSEQGRERVHELMTRKPISALASDPVSRAREIMSERRVRHVPIVDELDRVVGILTTFDMLMFTSGRVPGHPPGQVDDSVPIREVMAPHVDCTHQDAAIRDAAMHMLRNKRTALPVIDDGGLLVGILTESDFVRKALREG